MFPWNSPAIISVVPRRTFNIFLDNDLESMEFTCHYLCCSTWNIQSVLDTDLEFPWNSPAIISLFHVEHSMLSCILTWSFHGIHLPLSLLFHVEHSIFSWILTWSPWNSPAIISVIPRGTFNLFWILTWSFHGIHLPLSPCSTWNIQCYPAY